MLIYYGTGITTTISFRKYEGEHSFIKEGIPLTGSVLRCVSPVNAGRLHAVRKRGIFILNAIPASKCSRKAEQTVDVKIIIATHKKYRMPVPIVLTEKVNWRNKGAAFLKAKYLGIKYDDQEPETY